MVKKSSQTEEELANEPERQEGGNSFFDYLRFGESYTSLILGIIVVIISTALLLSFLNNRNAKPLNPVTQDSQSIAQITQKALSLTTTQTANVTNIPTEIPGNMATATPEPTKVVQPTVKPTTVPTVKPTETKKQVTITAKQTVQPTTKPTVAPTAVAQKPNNNNSNSQKNTTNPQKDVYVVKAGDNLWNIAQDQYKSGYNWVDISRANNLSNPGDIHVGDKLKLPKVVAKTQTVQGPKTVMTNDEQNNKTVAPSNKLAGTTYTVVHGDTLWDISVKAYGTGFKYHDIVKANNLVNPSIIHAGNKLKIPPSK